METKFNSQICTDKNQSERLLALGLKKETADMCWTKMAAIRGTFYVPELAPINMVSWRHTPAWSLHRLIEMCDINPFIFYTNCGYDNVVDRIEELIKEGYFNKEYLENGN